MSLSETANPLLAAFLAVLAVFHLSEALLVALVNRRRPSWGSLLFSSPYCMAMSLAIAEFLIEAWLFPTWKLPGAVAAAGAVLILAGELLRKAAIVTAGKSFTHQIAKVKSADHRLVTWGVYAWCRHPAYLGWSLWCIGTQLLLVNPLCAVTFGFLVWRFFAVRIPYEERLLEEFFRDDYAGYQSRVPAGLPLICGRVRSFE